VGGDVGEAPGQEAGISGQEGQARQVVDYFRWWKGGGVGVGLWLGVDEGEGVGGVGAGSGRRAGRRKGATSSGTPARAEAWAGQRVASRPPTRRASESGGRLRLLG
jgi:hypothetical protein